MSRAIDAMVAEKVMGWIPCDTCADEDPPVVHLFPPIGTTTPNGEVPAFSTDPRAAWEVVDKMRPKAAQIDIFIRIRRDDDIRGGPVYCCYMHGFNEDHWKEGLLDEDAIGDADKVELAICLAALRARGCPESEIETAMKGASDE